MSEDALEKVNIFIDKAYEYYTDYAGACEKTEGTCNRLLLKACTFESNPFEKCNTLEEVHTQFKATFWQRWKALVADLFQR